MSAPGPAGLVLDKLGRQELARELAAELAPLLADMRPLARHPSRLVDAATLAAMLGISRDAVYHHAAALGAIRIGDGPRGRLRFHPEIALEGWIHRSSRGASGQAESGADAARSRSRRGRSSGSKAKLLLVHGEPIALGGEDR
jgi:hypothetical protein